MPATSQIILWGIISGYVLFLTTLTWGWIHVRGWESAPSPQTVAKRAERHKSGQTNVGAG
jgi:hypothetical protein